MDDASSGKRMMEETDNGRGLVTLHRRQEGGRQTRVGAGREKRVIPASWNHPPAVAAVSQRAQSAAGVAAWRALSAAAAVWTKKSQRNRLAPGPGPSL